MLCILFHNQALTILSRYILRQHLGPLLFGLALIVFVLMLDAILQMMDQVLSKGLSSGVAGRLFLYNLAWIVALAVPMAVLVAALMAFGRLAVDNEITAAKASGIGFVRLVFPVLAGAAILAALMVLFNDRVLPDWNHRARNLAADLQRRKAALALKQKEGAFIHGLGPYSLLIRQVDEQTNRLRGITLLDSGEPGAPAILHAAAGELSIFAEGSYVRLVLEDGEFHRIEAGDPERFSRGSFRRQVVHVEDPQRAFNPHQSAYRSDREMDIAALYRAAQEHRRRQEQTRSSMDSAFAAFAASLSRPDSAAQQAQTRELQRLFQKQWSVLDNSAQAADAYWVEIHKKFSIPFACVVFVLVGAPLGTLLRRRGAAVSVGISLAFFWAYWMFLIGGEELADRGYLSPALSMWAPNLVFGALGICLLRAAALDRPLWRRRPL